MRVGRFIIITVLSLIHHAGGKIDALQKKRSVGVIPGDDALEKLRQIRERASPSEVNDEETDGAVKSKTKKHTAGATAAKPPPQAWEDLVKAPIKDSVNKAAIPDEYRSAAAAESVKAILSAVTAKTGIDTAIPGAASVSSVSVPRAREACYPCPQSALADPATAAIRFFWEDNLLDANSCACSTLKTKGDDAAVRIAKAVYAATLKFAQSLAAEAGDGPDLQPVDLQGRSALLPLWELLAPFPSGRQNIDGDPVMAQLMRDKQRHVSGVDIIGNLLRSPLDERFPSELAEDGFVQWVSVNAAQGTGLVDVKFPWLRWGELVQSLSTPGVLQFQGWARGTTFAALTGPHILACRGVDIAFLRNDNSTRILAAEPRVSQSELDLSVFGSVDLKVGPVGIVIPISGSLTSQFSCHLMESSVYRGYASMIGATAPADVQQKGLTAGVAEGTPSPAETGQGATSKRASVSNRRGDQTSSAVLVLQAPRHLSDMLLDYPLAPPSEIIAEVGGVSHKWDWGKVGNSSAPNSGKGLLLSGFFTLPVLNADSRIASVRFELEGQQHLLHEFSVRVAKAPTRSSKAEYFTSSTSLRQDDDNAVLSRERGHSGYRSGSAAAGESDLDIPPGQLLLVPLQLFVADESIQTSRSKEPRDIYLICKKQEGGGIAGMLSLSVIPARGNRLLVPLIFPCRRLNETLLFSFQLSDGSVSEAVVIAPVMALPGVNSKVEMQTGEAEPSASSQKQRHPATPKQQDSEVASSEPISIRGKGVASRGSSGGSRDKARRGSDASKRFDTLRSVNAADYSSSTAARLMAEREDTLNSATKYNLLSKDSADRAAGTAFNPAPAVDVIIESDVAVFKSQFYVHHNSFVRGKVVSSEEEEIFFQYTCNSKVGYMVSALSFAHGERDSFPVLISLHGEESNAREMAESYRVLARGTLPGLGRHTDTHVSRLGVEGFWVLAPSRRSARRGLLWDHVSMESIEDAVMALSRLTRSFQRLPGVVTEAGRLVMGHGAGAHAAVLAALSRADAVSCLAPISLSFLRKESLTEIGSVDSFFGVDAAFMDPALVELLTRSQAEQHIDRLAENAVDMAVLVRVGARDTVSHPWISKRFNRLVLEAISSAEPIAMIKLDIVRNQGHWWSDTVTAGDGGVTNDIHMREFYSHCRARSWHDLQAYAHYYTDQDLQALSTSSDLIEESVSTDGSADKSIDTVRNISELPQQESQRCGLAAFTLSLFNPSSNNGMCGIRVIQQLRSLSKSEVHVQVLRFPRRQLIIRAVREINMQQKSRASENSFEDFEPKEEEMAYFDASAYAAAIDMAEMESDWVGTLNRQPLSGAEAGGDAAANMKRSVRKKILSHPELDGLFTLPTHIRSGGICIVRTLNVRRLQLNQLLKLACRGNYSLGAIGSTQTLPTLLIVDGRIIRQPGSLASAVIDRVLVQLDLCWSSTGTNQRDISVFLCSRPVDPLVERAAVAPGSLKTLLGGPLAVVFGTPSHLNLRHMLRDLAVYIASSVASSTGKYVPLLSDFEYRDMLNGDVKSVGFTGFENVVFIGGPDSNKAVRDIYDFASAEAAIGAQMPVSFSKQHHGFTLGSRHFDSPEDAVLFLFPMARLQQSNNPIPPQFTASFDSPKLVPVSPFVGICIAANSLSGYFHASRLLHSNNLISTQGPFFSMLPDFVVFSAQIWSHGLAKGSQLVGYWNATWNFDEAQSCSSSNKYF